MLRITDDRPNPLADKHYIEGYGLSTDDKPTDVLTGSRITEVDTSDVYLFNEAGPAWVKSASGGGGGGSDLPADPSTDGTYTLQNTVSSGSGTLAWGAGETVIVHDEEGTLDKTWQEIANFLEAGKLVLSIFSGVPGEGATQCPFFAALSAANTASGKYELYTFEYNDVDNTLSGVRYEANSANDYPVYVG